MPSTNVHVLRTQLTQFSKRLAVMASTAVCVTPVKKRSAVFNTRTAGGRIPLTPSPRTPRTQTSDVQAHESIHGNDFNR